jgi:LysM repeat protein
MKADANAKAKAKSSKPKFRKIKGIGKAGVVGAVAGEVVSLAKGSTKKDFNEINRLEAKLADLTGKGKGKVTAGRQGAQQQLSQLASLASMGIVGKTRRQRMDELNRLIAKAEKANKPKELRYGKDGSSLVPGTAAYKAGSKTKPAYGTTSTGGGSTTKVDSRYTVKKGDTLSGIAKTAGVSLSEIRAANPEIMKKKKYKQGSMIWSGTKVNIPKKK